MLYRKLLPQFLQPNKCFCCSSREIFIHQAPWGIICHFMGIPNEINEFLTTYLKKSSLLNQLAKGKQAEPSQIWGHRESVGSSHSRGCVGAWWWCTSHLGRVLYSTRSTSHSSFLGHLQKGRSEQWGEVQDCPASIPLEGAKHQWLMIQCLARKGLSLSPKGSPETL